jgi:hypothetical protein
MKKFKLSMVALALVVFTSTQAQARSLAEIYEECGIGAMLFKDSKTMAAISNVIWDLGTTATSTNVSSPETCAGKSAKVASFVATSYDKLESEIVAGSGKYLKTLSKISGKSESEIRASFKKVVASKEFATMKKQDKAEKLFEIVSL